MKLVVHPDYSSSADFLRSLPQVFMQEGELIYDKRNKVKRFSSDGGTWIVKKFKRPNIIQRISYTFFKKSKAERAFLYAGLFRECGLNTPHEVAYIELKEKGLFADSYFVSTECKDAPLRPILDKEGFDKQLADELANFLVEVHRKGVMHGDINLSNVLYHIEDGQCVFTLIDTNRSKFLPSPNLGQCMDNLKRLTHNRELLEYVIRQYARIRHWEAEACVSLAFQYLEGFEEKVRRKRKFLSMIGIKKKR